MKVFINKQQDYFNKLEDVKEEKTKEFLKDMEVH